MLKNYFNFWLYKVLLLLLNLTGIYLLKRIDKFHCSFFVLRYTNLHLEFNEHSSYKSIYDKSLNINRSIFPVVIVNVILSNAFRITECRAFVTIYRSALDAKFVRHKNRKLVHLTSTAEIDRVTCGCLERGGSCEHIPRSFLYTVHLANDGMLQQVAAPRIFLARDIYSIRTPGFV